MNILITGAAGFVGSNMSTQLLSEGHNIWAADNFTTGQRAHIEELSQNPNFTFFEGGIETPEFVSWCNGLGVTFDQVFHFACPTGVPNIETLGEEMLMACSEGTKNVLEITRQSGAKFIETSSSEIYGDPLVSPQSEEYTGNVDPIGWRANYEEGKRFSETWVK
ncbi:MAG: NAD-dependent epimerase/dehydratase family protein, partial [Patescibacteria group bacterium]